MTTKKTTKKRTTKKVAKKATKKNVAKKTTKKQIKRIAKKTVRKVVKKKTTCKKRCKPSHAFWVNNGPIIHSVNGLIKALKNEITDEQFDYHTKRDGNDFANWIKDCLCDSGCASRLKRVRSKDGMLRVLSKCSCK